MLAPPLLAGMTALLYSVFGRVIVNLRPWKRGYVVRIVAGLAFLLVIGIPHMVSMILYAGDNQASSQPLDILLFLSPMTACASLGDDVRVPYPFLTELLGGTGFYWVTLILYAVLTVLFGAIARLLVVYRGRNAAG